MSSQWRRFFAWIAIGSSLAGLVIVLGDISTTAGWRVHEVARLLTPVGIILCMSGILSQERRPLLARALIGLSLLLSLPALIITFATLGQPR